ncbi:MAG: PfkB family carbohydrate kinase, partial [Caldimonas sp.]
WGLTSPGLGEQRYVASVAVSRQLQAVLPECDLIVGTEEEIRIAGGAADTLAALRELRRLGSATLVVKRGAFGCVVFEGPIPDRLDDGRVGPGFEVEVFNVLGAGDAFMAGFLRGWLRDEPLARCCAYANACGALVVSRHGCAPAMPSEVELHHFLAHGASTRWLRKDADLEHLHRTTTRTRDWPELAVLAFDHRSQFEELAAGEPAERIARFKALLADGARRGAAAASAGRSDPCFGVIVDDRYGEAVLPPLTGATWWVARPVELPGSRPLQFEAGADLALALREWPTEHVAKCLVVYHPDDAADLRREQLDRLTTLQAACLGTDREFLIEVVPPRDMAARTDTLARALEQIYAAGIRPDWWKLPPPPDAAAWQHVAHVVLRHDPRCRGVLLLGLEANEDSLAQSFRVAAPHPICKGFAVGRSIFAEPAADWFAGRIADTAVVERVAARYARLIAIWREARPHAAAAPLALRLTTKDTA